jgi:hypothetical protein
MPESEALTVLRTSLEDDLREGFGTTERDSDGDFVVRQGSAVVWVRPLESVDDTTFVRMWSFTNTDVRLDTGLSEFLATENGKLVFGRFELDERTRPTVVFSHTLLGDFLNRAELEAAVRALAVAADLYDDQIKERFGGTLFRETRAREPVTVSDVPEAMKRRWQAIFGALALAGAIAGAIYAYSVESSVWLSVFVALMVLHVIGRGAADVVTDPDKVRRALYFLMLPALATAVLYGAHQAWGEWWLAVVLGLVVGSVLNAILAPALFPRVHREETEDTAQRMAQQLNPAAR